MSNQIYWAPEVDCEHWYMDDPEDAVREVIDNDYQCDIAMDTVLEIFQGECVFPAASSFAPQMSECLAENACDNHGEWSESWLVGDYPDLQKLVADVVDKWCKDNGHMPTFGAMTNIKAVKVKILNVDKCEWEFVPAQGASDE